MRATSTILLLEFSVPLTQVHIYRPSIGCFWQKVHISISAILLFLSDLLCGFAKTATELYVFRGFSGIATGGISALTMIIVSDIVTLRQRGKYQGILSSCVGIGNITGPFLAAAIIDHTTWRVLFWVMDHAPLSASSLPIRLFQRILREEIIRRS
jgi:MFS family permease